MAAIHHISIITHQSIATTATTATTTTDASFIFGYFGVPPRVFQTPVTPTISWHCRTNRDHTVRVLCCLLITFFPVSAIGLPA